MGLASFAFSWGFILVKGAGLAPAVCAFYRLLFGAGTLLAIALVRGSTLRPSGAVIGAGIAFGMHQILFIGATQTTSIALVTLIQSLQPLIVGALSQRALRERVPRGLYGCALLALLGVATVMYANRGLPNTSLYGVLLSLLNLATYTAFFLFSKRARARGAQTLSLTALSLGIALLSILPFLYWTPPSGEGWQIGLMLLMALLPGNGHLLVNWAHPRVGATLSSIILALVPVFASLWAHLIFGEPYGPLHVLGTLLTLSAVELGRRVAPF